MSTRIHMLVQVVEHYPRVKRSGSRGPRLHRPRNDLHQILLVEMLPGRSLDSPFL
jgi:hypothetical protein